MKISLIQSALYWEDKIRNREHFSSLIASVDNPGLIILPEMFTTGFTMNPQDVAESMDGETVSWMQELATDRDCAIMGSVVIGENGQYFNRLIFATPSQIHTYDKRHLFSLAGENKAYSKGDRRTIIEYEGWKICPLICYDLRFPVFSRNTDNYDLLIYVANWPEPRIAAWDVLLKARAIENVCFVAGVNRIGSDDNGHHYPGHSQLVDCFGAELVNAERHEGIFTANLSKENLVSARKKFSFLEDMDEFKVM